MRLGAGARAEAEAEAEAVAGPGPRASSLGPDSGEKSFYYRLACSLGTRLPVRPELRAARGRKLGQILSVSQPGWMLLRYRRPARGAPPPPPPRPRTGPSPASRAGRVAASSAAQASTRTREPRPGHLGNYFARPCRAEVGFFSRLAAIRSGPHRACFLSGAH